MPTSSPRARRVSMVDVARAAGVSQKTVSRVVNDEPYVTDEVRDRVQHAIDTLGFRPNHAARALVTRRSHRIGVVTMGGTTLHGPVSVLAGVEDEARRAGYALSIVSTAPGGGREIQDAVDSLVSQGAEAIIVSEPQDFGGRLIDVPDGIEVLTFNSEPVTSSAREFLASSDEVAGAREATRHLLGFAPRVDHICGPTNWLASRSRIRGWRDALEAAGAEVPDPIAGDWSPRSGVAAMRELLDRGARAVFVANDQMAIGAMSAIHDAGLRTGIDVALVGFDDLDVAEFLTPPLSSVHRDFRAVSRVGMRELLARLDGSAPGAPPDPLPSRLVVRASSALR